MGGYVAEPCGLQLFRQFRQRVGIASRRIGEHGEAEARGHRRRDAIRIRDEFKNRDAAARLQRAVNLRKKARAGRCVEMMQEVGHQGRVESRGKIHLERIAGQGPMAIVDVGCPRVLGRNREHVRPVHRENLRSRIPLSDSDPKQPVTSGDIQY